MNVDNTLQAIRVKGYEQYYTPHFTSVPIFITREKNYFRPKYVLTNNNNRDLISYWHDEARWLKIEGLLPQARLRQYIKIGKLVLPPSCIALNLITKEKPISILPLKSWKRTTTCAQLT